MTFRPVNAVATRDQPTWQRRKLCPRCRTRFTCGHGEPGCWCESIVLRRETLAQIRALADDYPSPANLLTQLNRRLFGRLQGGFHNGATQARSGHGFKRTLKGADGSSHCSSEVNLFDHRRFSGCKVNYMYIPPLTEMTWPVM